MKGIRLKNVSDILLFVKDRRDHYLRFLFVKFGGLLKVSYILYVGIPGCSQSLEGIECQVEPRSKLHLDPLVSTNYIPYTSHKRDPT